MAQLGNFNLQGITAVVPINFSQNLLFKNCLLSLSALAFKYKKAYYKKCAEKQWLVIMKIKMKKKSRSHIYDTNRPRLSQTHKHIKYKIFSLYNDSNTYEATHPWKS